MEPSLLAARGVAGLLIVVAIAGCVSDPSESAAASDEMVALASWEELGSLAFDDIHDHGDREIHQEIQRGLQLVGFSTFTQTENNLGLYIEADHVGQLIAVGVVTGPSDDMTIVLLDATALPELREIGRFDEPTAYGDVKLDHDLPLAYVPFSAGSSFAIWDVSDPAAPTRLGEVAGVGCHMLHPITISGTPHVWCAGLSGAHGYRIIFLPDGTATGVHVGSALPQDDPALTAYLTYYSTLTPLGPALLTTPHDMTAQPDPLDGTPTVVTAYELQGIRLYDVTDPSAPIERSAWRGQGMAEELDRVHTVGLFELDGRRIGVGTTETFQYEPPVLYIVDFTDLDEPVFLGRWEPPGLRDDQYLVYSLHNFQVVGDRMYLTAFHGGFWVLDISDPAAPGTLALRVPVRDTGFPYPGSNNDFNQYWDVIVVNGYAVLTDMSAGVEVVAVDGDPHGDPEWMGFT